MIGSLRRAQHRVAAAGLIPIAFLLIAAGPERQAGSDPAVRRGISAGAVFGSGAGSDSSLFRVDEPARQEPGPIKTTSLPEPRDALRSLPSIALYGLIWLAPIALMLTAFVRINIVLVLLRQALGSPQVPGNQVLMVLALLLTALVMRPVGERVYNQAILPYTSGQSTPIAGVGGGFDADQGLHDRPDHPDQTSGLPLVALSLCGPPQPGAGRAPVRARVSVPGRGTRLSA